MAGRRHLRLLSYQTSPRPTDALSTSTPWPESLEQSLSSPLGDVDFEKVDEKHGPIINALGQEQSIKLLCRQGWESVLQCPTAQLVGSTQPGSAPDRLAAIPSSKTDARSQATGVVTAQQQGIGCADTACGIGSAQPNGAK